MNKLKSALLGVVAALSPLKEVLIVVFCLVLVDFITGIMASVHKGEKIESNRLKSTVVKLFLYQLCVIMGYYVGMYLTGPDLPMLKVVTSMIGIVEVQSVLENLSTITNNRFFSSLSSLLTPGKRGDDRGPGEGK